MNIFQRVIHPLHGPSALLDHVEQFGTPEQATQLSDAITAKLALNIPWFKILLTALPFLLTGDIPGMIAAILALVVGG